MHQKHAADPWWSKGFGQDMMVWVTRDGTDILGSTGTYVAMSGLDRQH
jgi:hypothetical protein